VGQVRRDHRLAAALAAAFLAGRWAERPMVDRARTVTGPGHRWLRPLVRDVLRAYPDPPADRPRALARLISANPHVTGPLPNPLRWYAVPTRMGATPWPVPPLPTAGALADHLGLTVGELEWFADPRGRQRRSPGRLARHYSYRWLDRAGRPPRLLEVPLPRLRALQRRLLDTVLADVPPPGPAHGFVPGRSTRTGAARHAGAEVVVTLDLAAFFASVRWSRVYGVFRAAGYPEPVAALLTGLTTVATPVAVLAGAPPGQRAGLAAAHLPQGAPTSPALANRVAARLDRRLSGLADAIGATYTRYADDLTFSGDRELARSAGRLVDAVGRIAAAEGFRLQPTKTRVQGPAGRRTVTGIVVNERPTVSRAEVDALRALLHNAALHGPAAQNRTAHPDFRAHLTGRVAWIESIDPARAARLRPLLARIDW
jgi:RNA-directed DNA polymerase